MPERFSHNGNEDHRLASQAGADEIRRVKSTKFLSSSWITFFVGSAPLRRSHVFYDGSHGSNLKLLKTRGLIDVRITKVREITKTSNLLGRMFGFVTLCSLEAILADL